MEKNYAVDNNSLEELFAPLVIVRCLAYNHEAYIKDALNGFVMQQTDFPFVVVIVNDASPDNTGRVVEDFIGDNFDITGDGYFIKDTDYAHIIHAYHKDNKNCLFYYLSLRINHFGKISHRPYYKKYIDAAKYWAECEGDDYWTDPLKLQKQVDFLETHEDYSMCFHKVKVMSEKNEQRIYANLKEGDYSARDIYDDWLVPTCSVLYRNGKPFETNPAIVFGDIFLYLQLAERGKLHCMGFVGGVYRRHAGSVSCGYSAKTCVRLYHQYKYMKTRFPELKDISVRKQEEQGLKGIIYAPYFPGIWKYRFLYMFRHPKLFFTSFFTTTILSYTPIRKHKIWKKKI